jgi:hypothetical protein
METSAHVRIHDRLGMIAGMSPRLMDGEFAFCTITDDEHAARLAPVALGWFREREGLSLILSTARATDEGFSVLQPMRHLELGVFSALDGVGLTAAVASALCEHNIPCNMVAAFHHDHVFVPSAQAQEALEVLQGLQQGGADER